MVDITICFDTTGSMYPCLTQVRRNVRDLVDRIFRDVPGVRIGIVAHGDYCDEHETYLMKFQDLTMDQSRIIDFINNTGNTNGGDLDEAYEHVLHEVQKLSWSSGTRVLVMIADSYPHPPAKARGLDWKEEVNKLAGMGVTIYSVQCLNDNDSQKYNFFHTMAENTGGRHLQLEQFSNVVDILLAIGYQQVGSERVMQFQDELVAQRGNIATETRRNFDILLGRASARTNDEFSRAYSTNPDDMSDLRPCAPSKFQIIRVDDGMPIKQFVISQGLPFKTGRGFYEFTKKEFISAKKEVVLMDRATGDLFEGRTARSIAGIPVDHDADVRPSVLDKYRVFVQSTSYNRKLVGGTGFLYEVDRNA